MSAAEYDMNGKVVLITGGRTGIGRAFALAFAQMGADVAISSRTNPDGQMDKVVDEVNALGRRGLAIISDVSIKKDVDYMVEETTDKLGDIDVLINNAGISPLGFLLDTDEETWDRTMNINAKGLFLCSQAVARLMVRRKTGNIINMSSTAGLKAWPDATAYCASKAAVAMLTKTMAKELGDYGIRVNAIAPGLVPTSMSEKLVNDPEHMKFTIAARLIKRLGTTDDMVHAALFLASDASSWITGHILPVEGGYLV